MKPISSNDAPPAIGPYSQAIRVQDLVFLSGQIGLDPKTGELVQGGVGPQAEQVMKNLGAVLAAAGCSFADVARTTIYLVDLKDFQHVNSIYAKSFSSIFPARATVEVAALPRGALVEIDAIAAARA
jgi:2-iminobutanoate/2-iminopropanoate deaminase